MARKTSSALRAPIDIVWPRDAFDTEMVFKIPTAVARLEI